MMKSGLNFILSPQIPHVLHVLSDLTQIHHLENKYLLCLLLSDKDDMPMLPSGQWSTQFKSVEVPFMRIEHLHLWTLMRRSFNLHMLLYGLLWCFDRIRVNILPLIFLLLCTLNFFFWRISIVHFAVGLRNLILEAHV
jgi:hypothetical protein